MSQFYTTAILANYESDNAMHVAIEGLLMQVEYYMVSMCTVNNIEEWKLNNSEYEFVQIRPDQEEITSGTIYVYVIKQFGPASRA